MKRQTPVSDMAIAWQERYHQLLDSLNIGIMLFTAEYKCLVVNETVVKMSGRSREYFENHYAKEWYGSEEFEGLYHTVVTHTKAALKNKTNIFQFESFSYHRSGEKIPNLACCSLNFDANGRIESIWLLTTDIRQLKQTQQQLEAKNRALEESRNALQHANLELARSKEALETEKMMLEKREQELFQVKREMRRHGITSTMIAGARAMAPVLDTILRCAEVDSSVLILGETGAGKEVAARAIHAQSPRKNKPFVAVNCGALPETLLESELFGHQKGAFTGAVSSRSGLFREAEGGTLFLDEIGDLSQPLQVKLLRALQDHEIRPLGSSRSYQVDVRVITATHSDLAQKVETHQFRQDLYYRIAVITMLVPPLRERKEDILPLVEYFIKKHGKHITKRMKSFNHDAQKLLMAYNWPGNIRELENCVEHALAMSRGASIGPESLPVQIANPQKTLRVAAAQSQQIPAVDSPGHQQPVGVLGPGNGAPMLDESLPPWQQEEKQQIIDALIQNKGNRTRAARMLGVCRTTLWRKIGLYRINL